MNKRLLGLIFVGLLSMQLSAQIATKEELHKKKMELMQQRKSMTKEQINDYYKQTLSRKPKFEVKDLVSDATENLMNSNQPKAENKSLNKMVELPADMIFPIESDEVQAILMSWSYDTRTLNGEAATQVFENWGLASGNNLVQVVSVPDVSANSEYANLFAELANGIQKHAQVWITLWAEEDTTAVLDFMTQRGTPLTNYRFFFHPGNAFWFRDFGPVAFYYGENDDIAFIDFEYYGGRPLDDSIPMKIAEDLGWNNYVTGIEYEGGNILLDGLGTLFTTDAVYLTNKDTYGQVYITSGGQTSAPNYNYKRKEALTEAQVQDSLVELLNLSRIKVLPALDYDGGTGHIDLYCDMWEESGFVVAQYPEVMENLSDPQKVKKNLDTLLSMTDYFGENYTAVRIPLPAKNTGSWYTSQTQYNNLYTRAYSNHTFVNDAIIQPVFFDTTRSGSSRGDVEGNKQALEYMKKAYPGYKFEPIDVRSFDGFGGAIHCITKQIPAENPVRIYHQPVKFLNTTENPTNTVTLNVLSQNKSGIESVKIFYRYASQSAFTEITCQDLTSGMYSADIPLQQGVAADTLYYYISSTSNNGKTITKPMTAPDGFYAMPYGTDVNSMISWNPYDSIEVSLQGVKLQDLESIGEFFPNPAVDEANVSLDAKANLYYRVVNLKGQMMMQGKISKGETALRLDTKSLTNGNYWVLFTDGNLSTTRKLVVAR